MDAFADSFSQYKSRYNEDAGIVEAFAASASEMSEEQAAKLTEKLSSMTGKKVILHTSVDPSLLGGVRLELDGKQYDGTVRERLNRLQRILSETVI